MPGCYQGLPYIMGTLLYKIKPVKGGNLNGVKLSRSLSGVEAFLPALALALASLSQRFILPRTTGALAVFSFYRQ